MNLRGRVIQLERKIRRTDDADENLLALEIVVVPSRGADGRDEREILLRPGGDDGTHATGGIENLEHSGGRFERQETA